MVKAVVTYGGSFQTTGLNSATTDDGEKTLLNHGYGASRGATGLVVAANDASARSKLFADYICDGVNDEVQINAALLAASTVQGEVVLSEGTFVIQSSVLGQSNTTLRGQGSRTILKQASENATTHLPTGPVIWYVQMTNFLIRDLTVDGDVPGRYQAYMATPHTPTDTGMGVSISASYHGLVWNVESHHNISQGIAIYADDGPTAAHGGHAGGDVHAYRCVSHDNCVRGLYFQGIIDNCSYVDCTVYNNWMSGCLFGMNASTGLRLIRCHFHNNNRADLLSYIRPDIDIPNTDPGRANGGGYCNDRIMSQCVVINDDTDSTHTAGRTSCVEVSGWTTSNVTIENCYIEDTNLNSTAHGVIDIIGIMHNITFRGNRVFARGGGPAFHTTSYDINPPAWQANHAYSPFGASYVSPTVANGFGYMAIEYSNGDFLSGASQPTWPTSDGLTVVDNHVTWKAFALSAIYNSAITDNYFFSSGYYPFYINTNVQPGPHDIIFANNVVESYEYGSIGFFNSGGVTGYEPRRWTISGNVLTLIPKAGQNVRSAVRDNTSTGCDGMIVTGNIVTHSSGLFYAAVQHANSVFTDNVVNGVLFTDTVQTTTLAAAATTIALAAKRFTTLILTGDAGANTIATITGGVAGQTLTIKFTNDKVTITDTSAATANTVNLSAAFTSAANATLTLIFDGTKWFEMCRSAN